MRAGLSDPGRRLLPQVLLVEAGRDARGDPRISTPRGDLVLVQSQLDWAYMTVPQKHTNGRTHYNAAGNVLGGGSVLNYGTWTRGDASDYDDWFRVVKDTRWSDEGIGRSTISVSARIRSNMDMQSPCTIPTSAPAIREEGILFVALSTLRA